MSDEEFDDEIILSELNDEELVQQMHDDLYDGLQEEVIEGVEILLERGWTPYKVLTEALVAGMTIVGIDFRDGILFVPEVLMAANAMKAGMKILRPLLAETGAPQVGKMVIGTVKGDIHDIGKNLVSMMMEGAGFEVIDIGINNILSPDWGDSPRKKNECEEYIFWACGVTPQNAIIEAKIPFCITHTPGHMLITDITENSLHS